MHPKNSIEVSFVAALSYGWKEEQVTIQPGDVQYYCWPTPGKTIRMSKDTHTEEVFWHSC